MACKAPYDLFMYLINCVIFVYILIHRMQRAKSIVVFVWIFVLPHSSFVAVLIPNATILIGGAFERWLDHYSGALTDGINAFMKEDLENALLPVKTQREVGNQHPGGEPSLTMLAPRFHNSSLQNCEKYCFVIYKPFCSLFCYSSLNQVRQLPFCSLMCPSHLKQ